MFQGYNERSTDKKINPQEILAGKLSSEAVSTARVWLDDVTFSWKVGGDDSYYTVDASRVRREGILPTNPMSMTLLPDNL